MIDSRRLASFATRNGWSFAFAWTLLLVLAVPAGGARVAGEAEIVASDSVMDRPPALVLPGAGSLVQPSATGTIGGIHSWMVVPAGTNNEFAIIHLPSRTSDATRTPADKVEGHVRLASRFAEPPAALAASGERVYFVQEYADRGGRVFRREVRSIAAVRSGLGNLWRFEPPGSSFRHPSLPGGGNLRGVAFSAGALFALIDESDELNPAGLSLLAMIGGEWRKIDLPGEINEVARSAEGIPRLFCTRAGVGIAIPANIERLHLWIGRLSFPEGPPTRLFEDEPEDAILPMTRSMQAAESGRGDAGGSTERARTSPWITARPSSSPDATPTALTPTQSWSAVDIRVDPSELALLGDGAIIEASGVVLWIQHRVAVDAERGSHGSADVFRLVENGFTRLATVDGISFPLSTAPLDRDGRVAFLWSVREEPSSVPSAAPVGLTTSPSKEPAPAATGSLRPSGPRLRHELREISVATGRMMYSGPAKSAGPVSPTDMRILSSVLLATMALALLLVLRPDPTDGVATMPEGFALAEPLRRIVASFIDLILSFWLAGAAWGIDPGLALSPEGLIGGEAWVVAATTVGIAIVLSTIGEWRVGRSPGKLLAGCEVVSVVPRDRTDGSDRVRAESGEDEAGMTPPRPAFFRALQRNAIKWLLPPIAVLGLFDAQSRHRADMLARTLVVVPLPEDQGEDDGA